MSFTLKQQALPLRLNLQFFSDSEPHPFADAGTSVEPHPFAAPESESHFAQFTDVPNPLLGNPEPSQLQPEGQGLGEESAQQAIEKLDFGGREVEVVDPVIRDLHKDYSNLTRTYQQTNQELLQARQIAEQWQQLAQQQQQQQPAQPEPSQQFTSTQISEERLQELNEVYMEKLYENKFDADQWWNEQPEIAAMNRERLNAEFQAELDKRLAPIEQEREALRAQQQAAEFTQKHPDFENYREVMQEVLIENPHIEQLPNALDVLYAMAKVRHTPETPNFESMLQDPQYQQQILANEQIRNMVFQQYQQSKMNTNQQLPHVMGNPVGSQTPMSAGESAPKTLSEATRNWLRSTGQY